MGAKLVRLFCVIVGSFLGYIFGRESFAFLIPPQELRFVDLFGLAAAGGMSGYLAGPWAHAHLKEFNSWLEEILQNASLSTLLGGASGAALGLVIANLVVFPLLLAAGAKPSHAPYAAVVFLANIVTAYIGFFVGSRVQSQRQVAKTGFPSREKVLDTSVLIDGRIVDIVKSGFIEGLLVIPNFILQELRFVADSQDPLRRSRGRRGLDVLRSLQEDYPDFIRIADVDWTKDLPVDDQLMRYAKAQGAAIITNDYNLNKHAHVAGVPVLNINDLANAVKSVVLPGEELNIQIIKEGKESDQGVGYLADGTMVVVEDARRRIGKACDVTVTNMLQTPAGRVIFARLRDPSLR